MDHSLSYREVIPTNISPEEWVEVEINTGTQHTLQDIKTSEKSGGYCYQNLEHIQDRNRFIYWRIYQDLLELTEISLDYTLTKNKIRLRFTDTTVLAVSITEHEHNVTLLVATISSLHRFVFPHHVDPKSNLVRTTGYDKESRHSGAATISSSSSTADTSSIRLNNLQSFSIFRDITSNPSLHDPNTYQVIDGNGSVQNQLPHAATCFMSQEGNEAYFALAYQTKLMFYVMNTSTGNFTAHELRGPHLMPRFLSNLKGAFIGRNDSNDYATSLAFSNIDGVVFLLALYRSDNLQLWSTVTFQSVSTISCLQSSTTEHTQGLQNSSLRKINDKSFCVYISHSTFAEFVCVDIHTDVNENNGYSINLVRLRSIQAPHIDMADFSVSESRIWALWNNAEGEFSISSFALKQNVSMEWVSAALEPPPPDRYCLTIEQGVDPREAYCSYIFQPGKFDRTIITKALYMFRRVNMFFDMKQLTMSVLKEQVCQAVEDEIQNEMKEFVISDEEYLEIALRLWERFYSCCEQYHLKDAEPIGIVIIDTIDAVCVVRKQSFSLLRPCDMLEHLMLVGEDADSTVVIHKYFSDSFQEGKDLSNLLMILSDIEKWLPEETKIELDKKMYQLEMPAVLISNLTDELLAGGTERQAMPPNFLVRLQQQLLNIKNLCHAVDLLHNMLRIEAENDDQTHTELSQTSRVFLSIGSLFGSEYGLSVVSETIKQTVRMRFALCRNLSILQQMIITNDTFSVPVDMLEALRLRFMPDTIVFLQAYYIMVWIAETPVSLSAPPTLETSMQRLCRAHLQRDVNRIYSSYSRLISSTTLLHLFLQSKGLYSALSLFVSSNKYQEKQHKFQYTLQPLIYYVNRLIWVVSHEFVFGEWLFNTCQHVIIQDYVRQLATWCEWNLNSRRFILAVSLLDCGETNKAYNLFLKCVRGVLKEKFLFERILRNTPLYEKLEHIVGPDMYMFTPDVEITNQAVSFYYLKVIQLFEQHNALNYIISMAEVVQRLLDKKDPYLPMFQSIVFNNHLLLEHFEEAYHSLIHNADRSRRKDCLRQLVITLFQRKRLDLLMRFPYTDMYDDFESIVESRAQSLTMEQNEVYNFLYAFHVNNENMRKASSIMYEQACRYLIEIDAPDALKKRCDSLLICINAMELTDERHRWIVKPLVGDDGNANEDTIEGDVKEVVVVTIDDVRRELHHSEALKELSHHRKDIHSYINASAQELSYLLASYGLFTSAITLGKSFSVSLLPIFDSLTVACVRVVDEKVADAWKWLQENDLSDLPYQKKASNMAWLLMQKLIEEYEDPDSTSIRKTVVNKLLFLNKFVPQWLFNSYKSSNCPELLNLFVKYNRLLEAADLAVEMINAMLGSGSEYFSFKHPIGVSNPPLALPVNVLDVLLYGLKLNSKDRVEYKVAHVNVEDAITKYMNELEKVKLEKVKTAYIHRRDLSQQQNP